MDKNKVIKKIMEREKLRNISKIKRLIKSPIRTIPYYFLATVAKIKPYKISFNLLWDDKMIADLPNGNTFLFYGFPEANLTNFFIKNLKEGDVFIDGGANIGFYSLLASEIVSDGKVHSFEPTPKTFEILKRNTGNKQNIKINSLALYKEDSEIEFVDYGIGYNSFNSIYKRDNSKIKELANRDNKIKVKATTLDKYCLENGIEPDFIKLDLEGSEYFALLGSLETIRKNKPTLSIEVAGDKEWIKNINETNRVLEKEGYKSFMIKIDGSISAHNLKNSYKYDNLIYIHKNNLNKFLNHDNN